MLCYVMYCIVIVLYCFVLYCSVVYCIVCMHACMRVVLRCGVLCCVVLYCGVLCCVLLCFVMFCYGMYVCMHVCVYSYIYRERAGSENCTAGVSRKVIPMMGMVKTWIVFQSGVVINLSGLIYVLQP